MRPIGWSLSILTAFGFGLTLSACGDARPAIGGTDGGGGSACTGCHGTSGRTGTLAGTDPNLAAAPPIAPAGEPAAVIGAHQAHLNPAATGSLTGPLACNECHVVPTDLTHATNPPPQIVVFGPLATAPVVPADGVNPGTPTWNGIATPTCSSVYCHGSFKWTGAGQGGLDVTGNLANAPDWTLGSSQAACGSCHGIPPTNHIVVPAVTTDPKSCHTCHPGTVDSNGDIVVDLVTGASLHVNGQIDEGAHSDPNWYVNPTVNPGFTPKGGDHTVAALDYTAPNTGVAGCYQCHVNGGSPIGDPASSCNACHASTLAGAATTSWQQNCVFCHGDKTKLLTYAVADQTSQPWIIAPPTGARGETATTSIHVGAHQSHVKPTANTLSNAFLCSECHTASLPTDISQTGHLSANGSVPLLLSGPIATHGGVTPVWTSGSASCSASYCHGNFPNGNTGNAPVWTGTNQAACGTCHAIPTAGGQHPLHVGGLTLSCDTCHPTGYSNTTVAQAVHVNGVKDLAPSSSFGTFSNWNPNTANANNWKGTATGCHGATRYWYPGSGASCQ